MPIGPTLPPHLAHLANNTSASDKTGSAPDEEDEEDDYAPALPPHLASRIVAGPSRPSPPSSSSRTHIYSSPSPPRLASRPLLAPPIADHPDDDDDGDIGPRPEMAQSAAQRSAAEEFREREERRKLLKEEEGRPKELKREEWMLVPPSSGVLSNVDPLKKRATTFSRSTTSGQPIDQTIWTETPSERAQRLADEVAGIKRRPDPSSVSGGSGKDGIKGEERKRRRDDEIRNEVARHTKQNRGPSLLEKHQSKDTSSEEPKAIWDHARDMGITGRLLNDQERQAKIKDARGLNDRFGHGKSGAYQA